MGQNKGIGLIVGVLIFSTVTVGMVLLLTAVALWPMVQLAEPGSTLPDLHEQFVDHYVDAGYEDPVLLSEDPLLKDRKIVLGHDVNARTAKDVVARLLYLNSVDAKQPIDLYISTRGGWADNAFAIIDAMRLIEAPVNTWAVGACYSSGAVILTAGTGRRVATANAIIMVHANLDDSSEDFSYDRLDRVRYEQVWRRTSELPESWYPMTSDELYYLSAKDALKFKIVDAIVGKWPAKE